MDEILSLLDYLFVNNRYLNLMGLASIIVSIYSLTALYPGAMTWDSLDQLRQARTGTYTDWQPPTMAFLWSLFLNLSDGPGAMLIFHFTLLWGTSLLLFKWSIREGHRFGFLFLILPLLPWVMNFQFTIWKDVGMAYSWGLSIAICIYFRDQKKFPVLAAALVIILFLYGSLVRSNSLSAGVFLMAFLCASIFKVSSKKSLLGFMIVGIVTFVIAHLSASALLNAKKANPVSYVLFDDVIALKLQGVDIPVSFLNREEMETIKSCDYLHAHEIGAAFCLSDEKFTEITRVHYAELKAVWLANIPLHFSTYANFRLNAFLNLIRAPSMAPYYYSEFSVKNQPFTASSGNREESASKHLVEQYITTSQDIVPELFKPYTWILISLSLVVMLTLCKDPKGAALWLLPFSGLSYMLSYFPITPAADFRYAYWMCFIASVSFLILVNIHSKKPVKQKKPKEV
ncbi:hypothetical protein C9383_02085 [Pseudomonas palleroniana]|uniref:Glycosyltransferase RgtA/B/C/D-like domain-containing protein n=1 Tax=Pseudomonas palleroniana TaxID=191390 RepID=A0A2T4G815_9PSED|nr:hypothetical protein [Pseudomonas palleroniana]KAB0565132.1 hypothetical protein F7R03_19155 [Pseudomonas palleroniana]PTC31821.1 hypothetical protein C9383_02085 [Pseudomonas palleroniana]